MILIFLLLLIILKFNSPAVYLDYLTGLCFLLCLVSAAYTLWERDAVRLEVDMPERSIHEGETFPITVRVVFPDLHGKLIAAVELHNLQRDETLTEKHRLADDKNEISFEGLHTGTIELSIPYVEVFGLFRVLRLKKRGVFSAKFNVYPCEGPDPDRYVRISYLPGGGEVQNAKGDDYSEIYEVRPLQEGDDLRHVHRQLSAKYDEYIVKVGSDSRRPVYNYYVEDGLDFPEMSDRIAQMLTLKKSLEMQEGSFMAAAYKDRLFEIVTDSQLYELADLIYENYLPAYAKTGKAGK